MKTFTDATPREIREVMRDLCSGKASHVLGVLVEVKRTGQSFWDIATSATLEDRSRMLPAVTGIGLNE